MKRLLLHNSHFKNFAISGVEILLPASIHVWDYSEDGAGEAGQCRYKQNKISEVYEVDMKSPERHHRKYILAPCKSNGTISVRSQDIDGFKETKMAAVFEFAR